MLVAFALTMLARSALGFNRLPLPLLRRSGLATPRLYSAIDEGSSVLPHSPTPPTAENSGADAAPFVPRKFVPFPFAYHEELEATVDSLTNLGVGVCRVQIAKEEEEEEEEENMIETRGWVVFVPSVLPGERVRLRVYRNHASYSSADLVEVLEPSEHRVTPKCAIFDTCGGCQYQHAEIGYQRSWKRQHVVELLEKIGGVDREEAEGLVLDTVGTDEVFHYRR